MELYKLTDLLGGGIRNSKISEHPLYYPKTNIFCQLGFLKDMFAQALFL